MPVKQSTAVLPQLLALSQEKIIQKKKNTMEKESNCLSS